MRDAGGELAERGELLRLHQAVLRISQVFQRSGELARARLHLVEQSYVFNRDHRLIREGLNELDLFSGERVHLITADRECADGLVLPEQRNGQNRPVTKPQREIRAIGELVFGFLKVVDVNRRTFNKGASGDPAAPDRPFHEVNRNGAVMRSDLEGVTLAQQNNRIVGLAEPRHRFCQRVENGLKIERRAADDLEHVGGRGLLLQRLAQLIEQARIFDRNHGLIGERGDQRNVTVIERPDDPSREYHDAYCDAFTHKRNAQGGSVTAPFLCFKERVLRIGKNVWNMDRACLKQRARRNRATPRLDGSVFSGILSIPGMSPLPAAQR